MVFTLSILFRFDPMPCTRDFTDLTFFRTGGHLIRSPIDELFGGRRRNVIDRKPIERHWRDVVQVAVPTSEDGLLSTTLRRRLQSNSRKEHIAKVFRGAGRSGLTGRYPADPTLRVHVTTAANKVERYRGFTE